MEEQQENSENKKKIIVIGEFIKKLFPAFTPNDEIVQVWKNERVDFDQIDLEQIDLVIVFGYGFKVEKKHLDQTNFINLHGSYLPFGKGPHPHIWGWIKNDPFGVTIHKMSPGMDEGDIIFRRKLNLNPQEHSIQSTLDILVDSLVELFIEKWLLLRDRDYIASPQLHCGSAHCLKDSSIIQDIIDKHRNSPIPIFLKEAEERLKQNDV